MESTDAPWVADRQAVDGQLRADSGDTTREEAAMGACMSSTSTSETAPRTRRLSLSSAVHSDPGVRDAVAATLLMSPRVASPRAAPATAAAGEQRPAGHANAAAVDAAARSEPSGIDDGMLTVTSSASPADVAAAWIWRRRRRRRVSGLRCRIHKGRCGRQRRTRDAAIELVGFREVRAEQPEQHDLMDAWQHQDAPSVAWFHWRRRRQGHRFA